MKAPLHPNEVIVVKGIPTTTPARIILDLLRDGEDLSLIANVFGDATNSYREVNEPTFAEQVDKLGKHYGLSKSQSLYERLGGTR